MKMTYTIVSESEANLKEGKISVSTPIAQGLLGKKVGDVAEIQVPQGKISLEVVTFRFNMRQVHIRACPILYIRIMATIFSRIIAGEIPCYKVAENEKFLLSLISIRW